MYPYVITGLLLLLAIWLFAGYQNYKTLRDVLLFYNDQVEKLENAEKKEEDTFYKAFLFNEKEDLINANLHLEELRQSYLSNKEKFKRDMVFSFLVLGPLYQLR